MQLAAGRRARHASEDGRGDGRGRDAGKNLSSTIVTTCTTALPSSSLSPPILGRPAHLHDGPEVEDGAEAGREGDARVRAVSVSEARVARAAAGPVVRQCHVRLTRVAGRAVPASGGREGVDGLDDDARRGGGGEVAGAVDAQLRDRRWAGGMVRCMQALTWPPSPRLSYTRLEAHARVVGVEEAVVEHPLRRQREARADPSEARGKSGSRPGGDAKTGRVR